MRSSVMTTHPVPCLAFSILQILPPYASCKKWTPLFLPQQQVQDTRYFHAFGSNEVGRSQCRMEVTWQQLREANLPTESNHYTDPNRLIQLVGTSVIPLVLSLWWVGEKGRSRCGKVRSLL
jgi:hypothetical protein